MTTGGESIVIGIFDDPGSADRAMMALQQAGYSNEQIRHTTLEGSEHSARKGIKALFSGEKAAPRKDITHDLESLGVDHEEARIYQHEYEAGHPLVSVEGRGNMQDAVNILSAQGARSPAGLANRGANYGAAGMPTEGAGTRTGEAPLAEGAGTRAGEAPLAGETPLAEGADTRAGETWQGEPAEAQKMRLHAEQLKAYKQPEQTGEVNVRKEVVSEQQTLNVPVTREEVVVERRSLAGDAAAAEEQIGEGETIRIPVSEEKVNVTKEAMATGEVDISKREVQENRQFSDTVRHEEAHIEKEGDIPIIDAGANQPPPDQPQI